MISNKELKEKHTGFGYGEGTKKERSGYHTPAKYVHEEALGFKKSKSKALHKAKEGHPKGYWSKGVQNYDTGKLNK